jgi:hypothetical protein
VICHLFLMNTLSDTQSIPVLLSFLFEKVNQVVTFKRMNMASATISNASTNTTRPRNISFTRIWYPHHTFIPYLAQRTQQHLVTDQLPLHLIVSSWSRAHLPINECGVLDLQIKQDFIPMLDIHPLYKVYSLFGLNNLLFAMITSWKMLS